MLLLLSPSLTSLCHELLPLIALRLLSLFALAALPVPPRPATAGAEGAKAADHASGVGATHLGWAQPATRRGVS